MKAEEDRSPDPVEEQLNGEEDERNFSFSSESAAFVPNSERCKSNRDVKDRPCWEEQLEIGLEIRRP